MKDFAVFKTGTHTSSNGITQEYSAADIDKACRLYNEQSAESFHEAPIVIGHPQTNAPAFGWIKSFYRKGDVMYAVPKEVNKDFEEAVKNGMYKKRSISFYPSGMPRHIGFLGAVPPAVKGLPGVEFSEDGECYEFSDLDVQFAAQSKFSAVADIFRAIKNWLIGEKGLEEADNIIKEWNIKAVDVPLPIKTEKSEYEEKNTEVSMENSKEIEMLKKSNANFSEENEKLKRQIAELQEKEKKARQADIADFCESLVKDGKLTPAQKEKAADFLRLADSAGSYDFSEGDKTVAKNALAEVKSFLSSLPKQVEFEEVANKKNAGTDDPDDVTYDYGEADIDQDRADLDKKVQKILKEQKDLSYREALRLALKEVK